MGALIANLSHGVFLETWWALEESLCPFLPAFLFGATVQDVRDVSNERGPLASHEALGDEMTHHPGAILEVWSLSVTRSGLWSTYWAKAKQDILLLFFFSPSEFLISIRTRTWKIHTRLTCLFQA